MKKFSTAILVLTLTIIGSQATAEATEPSVRTASRGDRMLLNLDRELKGATVLIYSAQGQLITSQVATRRRIAIDFRPAHRGSYRVILRRAHHQKEFHFVKK